MPQQIAKQHTSIRSNRSGFTLLELMVVVGIIGILIGILVTIIPRVKRQVYGAQTSAQLSALSAAIQQYYNDYKAYPGPLANNQLGSSFDPNGTPSPTDSRYPNASGVVLAGYYSAGGTPIPSSAFNHVTGTQNMTLGLLGGLSVVVNSQQQITAFNYTLTDILPDQKTPGARGAASLSAANPRRQQSYIQVRPGDISVPSSMYNSGQGASFADAAGRSATDAPIPVFLDKYPDPLPILYIRTNVGGQAIVGIRNYNDNHQALADTAGQYSNYQGLPALTPQFDLCQLLDYTTSKMGTTANGVFDHHGLQGVGTFLTDTIDKNAGGQSKNGYLPSGENGKNGCAYFRDPSYFIDVTSSDRSKNYDPLADNTHNGVAREKNGFLLITAGPDRVYGTSDDIIFPGSLQVSQ